MSYQHFVIVIRKILLVQQSYWLVDNNLTPRLLRGANVRFVSFWIDMKIDETCVSPLFDYVIDAQMLSLLRDVITLASILKKSIS